MSRAVDRVLGRDGGAPAAFGTRPFGTNAAEAQAAAAAAAAVPIAAAPRKADNSGTAEPGRGNSGTVSGTTGAAGSGPNLTTGSTLP